MYDDRCQKKDKDALCSLRLFFDLRNRNACIERGEILPDYFISVRDNCVGQNKSNVTMKYACLQSILFYKRVLLLFLLPGHIHMAADRAVALAKNSLKLKNLYSPQGVVSAMNNVKGIDCEFIDHRSSVRPVWGSWQPFLNKFFKNTPNNFTSNCVFEFCDGKVRMQNLVSDSMHDAVEFTLCENVFATRQAVMKELFGIQSFKRTNICVEDVQLPRKPVQELGRKKIDSISNKYCTIPNECVNYYPVIVEEEGGYVEEKIQSNVCLNAKKCGKRPTSNSVAPGTRPVGRPRKVSKASFDSNQLSILGFLSSE